MCQLSAFINSNSKYRQMLAVLRMLCSASHTQLEEEHFLGLIQGMILYASRCQLRGDKERAGTRGPSLKDVTEGRFFMTLFRSSRPVSNSSIQFQFQWLQDPLTKSINSGIDVKVVDLPRRGSPVICLCPWGQWLCFWPARSHFRECAFFLSFRKSSAWLGSLA